MTRPAEVPDEQFERMAQQRLASELGIWLFLVTEVLFFGGLFLGYALYHHAHPGAFAEAGRETDVVLGTLNTFILLTSSAVVAIAVKTAKDASLTCARMSLAAAVVLGVAFLGVKALEYHVDLAEGLVPGPGSTLDAGPQRVFFAFYWVMTGIHAVHVTIGVGLLGWMLHALFHRPALVRSTSRLAVVGLYWHFVDGVWIFLYPLLYLTGRAG